MEPRYDPAHHSPGRPRGDAIFRTAVDPWSTFYDSLSQPEGGNDAADPGLRGTPAAFPCEAIVGNDARPRRRQVNFRLVVMGPTGCGKSTVGHALSHRLGTRFVDADDLHPPENVAKLSAGIPLQDEDRWEWLRAVGDALAASDSVVVACSALKRVYRDLIREQAPDVSFLELVGDREMLEKRLGHRREHFMPASLVDSQLRTLEPLDTATESGLRLPADTPVGQLVEMAAAHFQTR